MTSGGYVLLRREGLVWAIASNAITQIEPEGAGAVLQTGGGTLHADEIVALVPDLEIRPIGFLTRRHIRGIATGLALYNETCVAVVDTRRPPAVLQPKRSAEDRDRTKPPQRTGGR